MSKTKNTTEPIMGVNNYVQHSMAILDRIHELLEEKFDGKQSELAKKMGKKQSEVSKWLNGVQNFTIFTISKLEEAFGAPIISIRTEDPCEYAFVQVQLNSQTNHSRQEIDADGELKEIVTEYEDFKLLNTTALNKKETLPA